MMFGERVRQVRELLGLTQKELARRLSTTQSAVAQMEANYYEPSAEVVARLSAHTGFPVAFFSHDNPPDFPLGSLLYRAHASVGAGDKSRAHRAAQIAYELADSAGFYAPSKKETRSIPKLDVEPQTAARLMRSLLGLSPDSPVGNLTELVERAGILVVVLPLSLAGLDAFSTWVGTAGERPVIAILPGRPGDRVRYNIAHELGHLVLHHRLRRSLDEIEKEANQFAGEFLLPEIAMKQEITCPVTLSSIAVLKPRWGVSIQALIRRAIDLDLITDRQYKYLFQQLSSRGWRLSEPQNLDVPLEKPTEFLRKLEAAWGSINHGDRSFVPLNLVKRFVEFVDAPAKQDSPDAAAKPSDSKLVSFPHRPESR
jgi:Zn-dependent peptidase ImmA (M78 family)/transcriptional regulator with XRE-family HTH domain